MSQHHAANGRGHHDAVSSTPQAPPVPRRLGSSFDRSVARSARREHDPCSSRPDYPAEVYSGRLSGRRFVVYARVSRGCCCRLMLVCSAGCGLALQASVAQACDLGYGRGSTYAQHGRGRRVSRVWSRQCVGRSTHHQVNFKNPMRCVRLMRCGLRASSRVTRGAQRANCATT